MKILYCIIASLFFATSVFASDGEIDGQQKAFNDSVKLINNIFAQKSTQVGKDGIKVICTIMPAEQMVSLAWEIENPNNTPLTIRAEDMRLYNAGREFDKLDTAEAITILYKRLDESTAYSATREAFDDLHNAPGENMQEGSFYESEFKFGDSDNAVIRGISYFDCRLKNLTDVTAEIKVNNETFKFVFDGGGP